MYFLMFIYLFLEREREYAQGRGRERGIQTIPSRLCTVSTEPDAGLDLTKREIMT